MEEEGRWRLHWQRIEARRAWQEAREGAYLLRTNLAADSAAELWSKYIQLTEAETITFGIPHRARGIMITHFSHDKRRSNEKRTGK